MEQLFRQEVLDRLGSPERLDELLRITSRRSWIWLISVCLVILSAMAWGFLGIIATKVDGMGIFIDPGGIRPVVAGGSGRLLTINVRVGERISAGQLVATLINPDLEKQLDTEKVTLSLLEQDFNQQKDLMEKEGASKRRVLAAQKDNILNSIRVQKDKSKWQEDRLEAYNELFEQGFVLKRQVIETRLERDNSFLETEKLENELGKASLQEIELQESIQQRLFKLRFDIQQSKGKIDVLQNELTEATRVISPVGGTVISMEVTEGSIVSAGKTIVNMETAKHGLSLLAVVQAFKGKKITEGMSVEITPSTVKREEYGYILGTVRDVSPYPVTADSLLRWTNNPELVQETLKKGPLFTMDVDLTEDPNTRSGFKWSSTRGNSVALTAGTLGATEVVVKRQAPITLVIPKLKGWIGE